MNLDGWGCLFSAKCQFVERFKRYYVSKKKTGPVSTCNYIEYNCRADKKLSKASSKQSEEMNRFRTYRLLHSGIEENLIFVCFLSSC